jgi:hypothetical protein
MSITIHPDEDDGGNPYLSAVKDVAEELEELAGDLHELRLELQLESDHGRGSAWHTEAERRLARLVATVDHLHSTVEELAWAMEPEDDEGAGPVTDSREVPAAAQEAPR